MTRTPLQPEKYTHSPAKDRASHSLRGVGTRLAVRATTSRLRDAVRATTAALVLVLGALACGPSQEVAVITMEDGGQIRILLMPDTAPRTVAHFSELVREGFYDGTTFHLVIPGFMIQGGDPNSRNDLPGDDGYGGPGYTVEDEPSSLAHVRGTVSLARTAKPNSGGSQFFIMVGDTDAQGQPHAGRLDGQYTAFGRVISGMDVADRIAAAPRAGRSAAPGQENRPLDPPRVATIRLEPGPGS
jgi:peptidyl-prolyl cis-trans isomerase B (cyclophilin B)